MSKFTKAIAALMLTVAVVIAAGCKKDPENGGNNNGGGNGGGDTPTAPTEEGMYLGIIGFNEQLYQKQISLLNNSTKATFKTFIENLQPADGTALYYADYTALKELQTYSEPPALSKVALVTFTDGLDNLSTSGSIMNPEGYGSVAAYRTALHEKIMNDRVHGKPITAYTIGLRGADVQNNLTEFQTNLEMLASRPKEDYVFEVTNMTEALERFRKIAEDLYHSVTTVNLRLKLPGGLDDGMIIRFTFDDITDGGNSTKYIQCTYKRTADNGRRLESISYYGFHSGALALDPVSQTETGTFHWFEFEGLAHSNDNAITQYDIDRLQLWKKQGSVWQRDSEFTPGSSSEVTETKTSALIVLVLDCTTSLSNDFGNMQVGAKQFVEALCSSNIGGGTSGGDYSPSVTTSDVTDIDYTSAKCGGTASVDGGSNITARGVCWSTNPDPTINDNHTNDGMGSGPFSSNITGLTQGTKYYVRAFATNSAGTSYGGQKEFMTPSILPIVTIDNITNVTLTSATIVGNVTSEGGYAVTERGVCWGTSQNPTITGQHANSGTGAGSYTINITGLTPNTTYYVRAYATNSAGTSYGELKTFTTNNVNMPTVTTNDATNITQTTATCGGNVTADGGATVTERGVCWGTTQNPNISGLHTNSGTGTGTFTINLTGLAPNTTYYVRAYATNSVGTNYGEQKTFTTNSLSKPTVTTNNVTNITQTTATCGGNVTADGGAAVTERGVCWSTSQNPTISGQHANSGTGIGTYSINMTELTPNTTYYVRAYATNSVGTNYGEQKTFTTNSLSKPTVTTNNVTSITQTSASCGGNVTADGGATVTARGVCWSTSSNPTINNSHTTNGTGTGSFTSSITGLTLNTTYYVRAYATNSVGTSYGEQKTFITNDVNMPTVTTSNVSNITQTSATGGGNVTNAGGGTITARGVCWSTSQNPTINNGHTSDGTGTGSFTSSMTGLSPGTTYYVRAYATNSAGTAYGVQKTFSTDVVINSGIFSVEPSTRVLFSPGNLQYKASSNTWRFAEHQYDVIGSSNSNISQSYSGWIDLFGWGTSGWNCGNTYYHPWDYNYSNSSLFGPYGYNNLTGQYANSDWGYYNAISNGGNVSHQWRTLTQSEWNYVFNNRSTSSGIRYAMGKVAGVNGVILLPDNWNPNIYNLNDPNGGDFTSNIISASQWNVLEQSGAIFLPAAGQRSGLTVSFVGTVGRYWSASYYSNLDAYQVNFEEGWWLSTDSNELRGLGNSVRLVKNY